MDYRLSLIFEKQSFLFLIIFWATASSCVGQQVIKWKNYGIQYESPVKLKKYNAESSLVYGRANKNFAVDIQVVPNSFSPGEGPDSKVHANRIAAAMELVEIKPGNNLPKIETAYYVVAKDIDLNESLYPVLLLIIVDQIKGLIFEITIDCYNQDLETGISIAKSFELIK